jgi:hypothetical protein
MHSQRPRGTDDFNATLSECECEELQRRLAALVAVAMAGTALAAEAKGLSARDRRLLLNVFQTLYSPKAFSLQMQLDANQQNH